MRVERRMGALAFERAMARRFLLFYVALFLHMVLR